MNDQEKMSASITKDAAARHVKINLCECHYPLLADIAQSLGLHSIPASETPDIIWIDTGILPHRLQNLPNGAKINHFPGMSKITRKDELTRAYKRFKTAVRKHGTLTLGLIEHEWIPRGWCLSDDKISSLSRGSYQRENLYYETGC